MLRIVSPNNYYYLRGGSERVLLDEEGMLCARGHEVIPFSTQRAGNAPSVNDQYFVKSRDLDRLSFLQGVAAIPGMIHNRAAGRRFGSLLSELRPDIIHCHNIYGTLTTSILVEAKRRGIPAVLTAHDAKLVCPSYLCLDHGEVCEACQGRRYHHCLLNRCHKDSLAASAIYTAESYFNKWLKRWEILNQVITPSRFLKSLLEKSGYPADWITYLPNPVDTKALQPNFKPGDYVLYAGRLSKEKGVLTLLKAAEGTGIPLRIVGDGPIRTEAQKFAAGRSLSNVEFLGYKSGPDLAAMFANAAFVVMPSEWYENGPISLLEAYAYGKPVLGARIGGIPEFIVPGETGELFESRNADELRQRMLWLWSNKPRLEDMGHAARRFVEQNHSFDRHYEGLMSIYHRYVK